MVDKILSESRLEIYDAPSAQPTSTGALTGHDEAADNRLADEFRRDFLAAAEEKIVRKAAPLPPGTKGDAAKGPKLGGSRSQRAAMRQLEGKTAKGKK